MSDATPRMYAWDIIDGACGACREREAAITAVGTELEQAPLGTVAEIIQVRVSGYDTSYELVSVVARAVRTDKGIVWSELSAALIAGES